MQKVVPINISVIPGNPPLFHAPILLFKSFKQKNKIWLGHITYIPLKEDTPYLSFFIDVCTRKIFGWAISPRMKEQLVIDSFLQSFGKERSDSGLIIHTDLESQYTSTKFHSEIRKKR